MTISALQRLAVVAASTVLAGAPLTAVPLLAAPAEASALPCRAHMGDATPRQYTYDTVFVRSAAYTRFRTVAHYKTTDTTKYGETGRLGFGSTRYYISGATPGYRVYVDVWLTKGTRHGHCLTSFVPHR